MWSPRVPWPRLVIALLVILAVGVGACSDDTDDAGDATPPLIEERTDWGTVFADAGVEGTFALREVGGGSTRVWNPERAAERRLPASTFKILNTMIILDVGVLPDVDTEVPWDGVTRDVAAWNRDHSLRTGIEVSAVWMYQAMARAVGEDRMAQGVAAARYGNADIGGGIDRFWLTGDLRISPLEQLDFLEAMETGGLPFAAETVDATREILVRESGPDWSWSHKTGTALADDPDLGWLVGTTHHDDRTWVFAMNLDLTATGGVATQIDPQLRQSVARAILEDAGALPPAP